MQGAQAGDEIVRFSHVSMQFPGVLANDDVSLSIRKGEIFALVGENGAGKSTLMNMLFGLLKPTMGEIYICGKKTGDKHTPEAAMRMGASMVHQHFKLVPSFTVAQNILLGIEPRKNGLIYDRKAANARVEELSRAYGLHVNPEDIVGELSVGMQQRVEILKALRTGAEVLVLDEPTAVLTPQETEELFEVIRRIVAEKQMTVILITHKLPEVISISSRVGVMRRGRLVKVLNTCDTDERGIASLMVGREVIFDDLRTEGIIGEEKLAVNDLRATDDRGLPALKGASLSVRAGEILGVCALEGNGQNELCECIMGMRPQLGGTVRLNGHDISRLSPREIRSMGVSCIPQDRISTGVDVKASVADNLITGKQRSKLFSLFGLHMKRGAVRRYTKEKAQEFDIRVPDVNSLAGELSGGNMQKVVIAREFSMGASVLIINQPTRGVDIGAIEFIHERIIEKRNEGCAILLVSADLDELFRLSDRLIVMFEGRVTGELAVGEATHEEVGLYMTGLKRMEVSGE